MIFGVDVRAFRRCALALVLLLAAASPAAAVERIIQFISDVNVQRDGDLVVTERSGRSRRQRHPAWHLPRFSDHLQRPTAPRVESVSTSTG